MIDICIVTKLAQCKFFNLIDSIYSQTDKDTLEKSHIYVCYTGESDEEEQHIKDVLQSKGTVIRNKYNFAKNNNRLAGMGTGKYILFLNDDIELKSDSISYCKEILANDTKNTIGTVGIKLLYPDDTIQHAGHQVYWKDCGLLGKKFLGITHYKHKTQDHVLPNIVSVGNTGAYLMIKRQDFNDAGCFNENYEHCFEDVELNWKMLISGKLNVTANTQTALHYESITRNQQFSREDVLRLHTFFNTNSEKILQNRETLKRTIIEVKQ